VVLHLNGVSTRTAAEAWVGTELYLDPAHLPSAPDDDTFRAFELEGMTVLAADTGEALGTVTALAYSPGGQSFIEVALQPHGVVRLIPFTLAFIPTIDRVAKTLTVQGLEAFLREEALMVPVPKKPKFVKGKAKGKRPAQAPLTPAPETPPEPPLT
jgi:ribosomal 30S subunit maturation factor RimM